MIPDCYEGYYQEEQRQASWDRHFGKLPTCCVCGRKIMDGDRVFEASGKSVCVSCMEELYENEGYVEVD